MHDIKVGFVTTESSARHLDEAHRNGAAFVVNKPFNTEELKQAVLSVLQDASGVEDAIEAAAPAEPPTAAAAPRQAIDVAEIASILSLSSIVCKIERIEPVPIEHVKPPYVIGIYSAPDSKAVDAVCLMDLNAACMLGGAMAKQSADQVKAAILAKTLNRDVYENCTSFLSDLSGMISRSSGKRGTLSSSHLVQKPFGKLFELMGNNYGRADLSISFPAYGDGFISVLLS